MNVTTPSTVRLLNRRLAWLRRFLILSHAQQVAIALWILHTWAVEAADYTPYLYITAPEKGCGKTRVLEVFKPIVCRPWMTGHATTAVLARKIAKDKPTLLLDESDTAFKGSMEYTEKLRGLLNAGFSRRGTYSLVTGKGAELACTDLSTFGPKAIAGIGQIPDTIASRSIAISMRRKTRTETIERFREGEVMHEAEEIRAHLQNWATLEIIATLRSAKPPLPEMLTDRQQDIAEALLAIADHVGGAWPEQTRAAMCELCRSVASEDTSIGVQLLQDIRRIFNERGCDSIFFQGTRSCSE